MFSFLGEVVLIIILGAIIILIAELLLDTIYEKKVDRKELFKKTLFALFIPYIIAKILIFGAKIISFAPLIPTIKILASISAIMLLYNLYKDEIK